VPPGFQPLFGPSSPCWRREAGLFGVGGLSSICVVVSQVYLRPGAGPGVIVFSRAPMDGRPDICFDPARQDECFSTYSPPHPAFGGESNPREPPPVRCCCCGALLLCRPQRPHLSWPSPDRRFFDPPPSPSPLIPAFLLLLFVTRPAEIDLSHLTGKNGTTV